MNREQCQDCTMDARGHGEIEAILGEGGLTPEERSALVQEALSRVGEARLAPFPHRLLAIGAAAAVIVVVLLNLPGQVEITRSPVSMGGIVWHPHTQEALLRAGRAGRRVALYVGDLDLAPVALTENSTIREILSRFECFYLTAEDDRGAPSCPQLICGVPDRDVSGLREGEVHFSRGVSLRLWPGIGVLEVGRHLRGCLSTPAEDLLGLEWVRVPRSTFLPKSTGPRERIPVAAFEITKYEVTNGQWHRYLAENEKLLRAAGKFKSYVPRNWDWDSETGEAPEPLPGRVNRPVVYIPVKAALDFCKWAGARLPTESEWKKAARGEFDGRIYPWGDEWLRKGESGDQVQQCNSEETGLGESLDVRAFGNFDVSPYGVVGMAGNVCEFVLDAQGPSYHGGCFMTDRFDARIDERVPVPPGQDFTWRWVGFRAARSPVR